MAEKRLHENAASGKKAYVAFLLDKGTKGLPNH